MRSFRRPTGHDDGMSLRDRLRPTRDLGLGKNTASSDDARRALARALETQNDRLRLADVDPSEVQLLGQVTGSAEWAKLLAYWERRNPQGIASWPRRLDPGAYALNLWPLPVGRIGLTARVAGDARKRQPKKLLCTPGLIVFEPAKHGTDAMTALAVVCATWLADVGMTDFEALRLAPPVLETWAPGGRLMSREVVDFGLDWPLPAPDGI